MKGNVQGPALGENDGVLNDVLELAYVSRPVVGGQFRNIFLALAQRGNVKRENAESIAEILAEATGEGLPPGRGTVQQGAAIYANKCAACHGPTGTKEPKDRLVGGQGSLATDHPVKTIGSYWPYATALCDYIFRAMSFTAPQSLTPNEVYALVAWLLHQNQIIPADAVIDAKALPAVTMPNRKGFIPDQRPDALLR